MGYYNFNEEKKDKIPYDKEPIFRQENKQKRNFSNSSSGTSKATSLVMAFVLILQIGLIVALFAVFGHFSKKIENVDNQGSTIVNITTDSAVDVSAVTTKAKMSSVCVHAGYTSASTTGPNYQGFFNMASKGGGTIIEYDKTSGVAYILTCYHVVKGHEEQIEVLLFDIYNPIEATLVGHSYVYDLAVLKIEGLNTITTNAIECEIADSAVVLEGEPSIAIGNPLGAGFSVTSGQISKAIDIVKVDGINRRVFRTSAPINSGNSGGGLFDAKGRFIGVVNAKSTDNPSQNNYIDCVAYAIPSTLAINLAYNIMRNTNPVKASLGITLGIKNNGIKYDVVNGVYNVPVQTVYVLEIDADSPLKGLIEEGYEIVAFEYGDKLINVINTYSFDDHSFAINKGDEVTIYYSHNGNTGSAKIKINKVVSADSQDWYD